MNRPRGRPPRQASRPSPADMLGAAIALLDEAGVEGFTMRALAARLQINPMTIYHHFGDREQLIAAMADRIHAGVAPPATGAPLSRIKALLRAYHETILRHPALTLLVFTSSGLFPAQARRITDSLHGLLVDAGLPAQQAALWLDILIDFTHGAALATAMAGSSAAPANDGAERYHQALAELLGGLRAEIR